MPGNSRPPISPNTKLAVWVASAGRCAICNLLLINNEEVGFKIARIGELAHIVGWSPGSPRGDSPMGEEERNDTDNLMLLCRNCHKPIDQNGIIGFYSVEDLKKIKKNHEEHIRYMTGIPVDRQAMIVRLVGPIRGVNPEISFRSALWGLTAAGYVPQASSGSFEREIGHDLREPREDNYDDPQEFQRLAQEIDNQLIARLNDGVRIDGIKRIAVFAFCRIPLLVHLGARLDDKTPAIVFQRHRTDEIDKQWTWPHKNKDVQFEISKVQQGTDAGAVATIINLSGTIDRSQLPEEFDGRYTVYQLTPSGDASPNPSLFSSPKILASFEAKFREFLASLERDHNGLASLALFPAIPISAAITIGRTLMPNVSPALHVYDRDSNGSFFKALEVQR